MDKESTSFAASLSGGVQHSPEADNIESIRDLLRGYGVSRSILKELIQNAEAPSRRRSFSGIVHIYGLWLNGHLQYVGVGRDPYQRVREFVLGTNDRLKSIIAQGARVVLLQQVPKRGSHTVKGRIVLAFKRMGDCGCNVKVAKRARDCYHVTRWGETRLCPRNPNQSYSWPASGA